MEELVYCYWDESIPESVAEGTDAPPTAIGASANPSND